MTGALVAPATTDRRAPARAHDRRPDIQVLRAVAVLAVLLYHLWPNAVHGGYVGVDVFFVISGFLITGGLLREFDVTGRVRLAEFWTRRARRLLPGALLVLGVVAVAILLLVPQAYWAEFFTEIGTSAFYVENLRLAQNAVDYLHAGANPSPVQHFWTLSVEEQFYIALPLVMAAVGWLARRSAHRRRILFATLLVLVAASFAFGVWYSGWSIAAYFSTATRAWEFGVGSLLAFAPAAVLRRSWATGLSLVGVAAIVLSVALFTASTPFPGAAALLPVLGTALAIWAARGGVLTRLGEVRAIGGLGDISYALYLWHWPIIAILPYAIGPNPPWYAAPLAGAASIAVASASTRVWENPIRFSPRFLARRRPRVVAAWCAAGMSLVMVFSGAGLALDQQLRSVEAAREASVLSENCVGAAAMNPDRPCTPPDDATAQFVPSLALVPNDDGNSRPDCWSGQTDAAFHLCTLGPTTGYTEHLLVLGDSHANSLLPAFQKLADDRGWRIDVAGHAGCYLTTARLVADAPDMLSACDAWRTQALAYLRTARVDAIVVTHSHVADSIPSGGDSEHETTVLGMAQAWQQRASESIPVIALVDDPNMGTGLFECLQWNGPAAASRCDEPRSTALGSDPQVAASLLVPNAHVVDLSQFYCTATECLPVIGGLVVYRDDGHHVTATYAATLAPFLEQDIAAVLGTTRPSA